MSGDFRKRVLIPALIPIGAFLFIGVIVYAVSRILLAVTTEGSVVVATLMAACILFGAGAVAKSGSLKSIQKIALIAFSLLLFGSGLAVEASLGPREVKKHLDVAATLVAQGITFDKPAIDLPADQPFLIELDNRDTDLHNVSIYTQKGGTQLFFFTPFPGPAVREFPSDENGIPKGVYFFQCDVHAQMNGTARAGEATRGPPPTPGGTTAPAPTSPSPSASPS